MQCCVRCLPSLLLLDGKMDSGIPSLPTFAEETVDNEETEGFDNIENIDPSSSSSESDSGL